MNLAILPKLTKELILQRVSQEEIFERYLQVPVQFDYQFNNPLRTDDNPTCSFKWTGNKLRMRDWSGYFWGDCFDLVALMIGENPNNKEGFARVLNHVAKQFRLHKYSDPNSPVEETPRLFPTGRGKEDIFYDFEPFPREWNSDDAKFWMSYHIHRGALDYFDVYPVSMLYINGNLDYVYNEKDPAYCYNWGLDEKGRRLFKIYFPFRKKGRFKMNCNAIEGKNKLQPAEIGVITKSYKDVICLKCITHNEFSIASIAPPSESHLLPRDFIEQLWPNYKYLVSLMDFDFAGRNMAWRLKATYNISPLFLTNGDRKTKNYGSKDFSDYTKKNGKDKSLKLIEHAQKYVKAKGKYESSNIKLK